MRRAALSAGLAAVVTLGVAGCSHHSHPTAKRSPSPSATPSSPSTPVAVKCPLTGLPAAGGQKPKRVALAVKIDNIDVARPQAGVDHADVVFEELVEGGLTRLFAVFQCDGAGNVGPIRSARPTDGDLLALLQGSVFAYSGANPRAIVPVREHGDAVLISNDDLPQYFHRDSGRPAPHNVFSSTETLLKAGLSRRRGLHAPAPLFLYGPLPSGAGHPATAVSLTWPAASAAWTWTGHVWQRTQNGTPDVVTGGKRVHTTNVVVMSVELRPSGIRDVAGNETPDNVVIGRGVVWVFRDGRVVQGHWRRAGRSGALRFYDSSGAPLRLKPGRTWVELLPQSRQPSIH